MHYNQWVFNGDAGIAFARIEVYGNPAEPESGWLEGLRVHPEYQGRGIMKLVLAPLMQRVPRSVHNNMYLAVGSGNEQMCTIADKKYTYIGAQVAFGWKPATAMPLSAESKTLTQQASLAELDLIWAFLCSHSLYENSRLLLPARFYGFRACSRPALEEKISAGRVYVTFNGHPTPSGTEDARECIGIFCTFDSDLNHGAALMRWHTCCLADGLSVEQIIAVLHAWTAQIPALDEAGSAITAHVLSVGPEPNDESKPDVAPVMQEALDAVGFSRNLPTHLRLYRYE